MVKFDLGLQETDEWSKGTQKIISILDALLVSAQLVRRYDKVSGSHVLTVCNDANGYIGALQAAFVDMTKLTPPSGSRLPIEEFRAAGYDVEFTANQTDDSLLGKAIHLLVKTPLGRLNIRII